MIVQLKIDGAKLVFDPPFRELRDIILRLLTDIVQSAEDLPRVSGNVVMVTRCSA